MKRGLLILFLGLVILLVLNAFFSAWNRIPRSGQEALQSFMDNQVAEDQLMDPLILASYSVVPLVVDSIKNKKMPRRRYAIGALGNIGDSRALEILEVILSDVLEKDYFRCDALRAIDMIKKDRGVEWANRYQASDVACLSEISTWILNSDEKRQRMYSRRTYFEALLGWHFP